MKVLLTGGAGYIGSHTAVELLAENHDVTIIDNFSNSKEVVIDRIQEVSNKSVSLHAGDVCDKDFVVDVCRRDKIDAAIHFAGLKAVGESVADPLSYYR